MTLKDLKLLTEKYLVHHKDPEVTLLGSLLRFDGKHDDDLLIKLFEKLDETDDLEDIDLVKEIFK